MSAETREFVQARLATRRSELREAIAGLTEAAALATSATPEWNVLDLLRHILAWQELALAALDNWTAPRDALATHPDEDARNEVLRAQRQHLDLANVLTRIHNNYDRFDRLLASLSDDELATEAQAPWGYRHVTRLECISGILWHDGEHIHASREA